MAEGKHNSHFILFVARPREATSSVASVCGMGGAELALGCCRNVDRRNLRDVLGHLFPKAALLWVCQNKRIVNGAV